VMSSFLHSFSDDAKKSSDDPNKPPNVLDCRALDENFRACQPMTVTGNNFPYQTILSKDGWRLEGSFVFDVCENGSPTQYRFFAERAGL